MIMGTHVMKIIFGSAIAAAILVLSACSGFAWSPAGDSSPSASSSQGVTLKLFINADWMKDGIYKKLFGQYERQSGNKVEVEEIPAEELEQLLLTRIATHEEPDILFYFGQKAKLKKINAEANFLELSNEPYMTRVNPIVTKNYNIVNGKTYGIPVSGINLSGVFYNKKVFADHGIAVPADWEQFLAVCEKLKQAGLIPIALGSKDGWPELVFPFTVMANVIHEDPEVMEKLNAHKIGWDKIPEFAEGIDKQAELYKRGYYNEDLYSTTNDMANERVATGQAGMVIQADWIVPDTLKKFPDAPLGFFPLPLRGADSVVGNTDPHGAFIFKRSKNIDASREFLKFVADPEVLNAYYAEAKTIPAWENIDVELNSATEEANVYFAAGKAAPFWEALEDMPEADYNFIEAIQKYYDGKYESGLEIAREMQAEIEKAGKAAGLEGW